MKFITTLSLILLIVMMVYTGYINYNIYKYTGEINLGLNGNINAFFSGLIMLVIEFLIAMIILWQASKKSIKESANPEGMTPIHD